MLVLISHTASASNSYEAFRQTHGRAALETDVVSYEDRRDLFHRRQTEVLAHNARNLSWTMTVNHFSDYSDPELRAMLGYKRVGGRWGSNNAAPSGASSFIEEHQEHVSEIDISKLAREVDWRTHLQKSSSWVRNQGACGSCWAVASVGALEMHLEKTNGFSKRLSHQQLVDCTLNPRHCGGTGGCEGATAELAFDLVRKSGISTEDAYESSHGGCNAKAPVALKVARYVRLPENKGTHLLHAVATHGPVVVSADGASWFGYEQGVFSGCEQDTVVNHAVLAIGYSNDPSSQKDYWLIRNSWGAEWGDKGFIKIERHSKDDAFCGVDDKPKEGVYCDDAPPSVTICGMCGITSDSAFPRMSPPRSRATRIKAHGNGALQMVP